MRTHTRYHMIALVFGIAGAALVLLLMGTSYATSARTPAAGQSAASEGGLAAFTTTHLSAGLTETFCLVYTTTVNPIAAAGGIRVIDPDLNGTGWTMWNGDVQTTDPNAPQYLTVTTNGSAVLDISRWQAGPQYQSYTTIEVLAGGLAIGDEVTLCYVNWRTPHKAYKAIEWQTLTDADGDATFTPISTPPQLEIDPSPTPTLMIATGPTYVEKGQPFRLTVRVLDEYSNPCERFAAALIFTSTDPADDVPLPKTPFPPGIGVREFVVTLNTLGIQYIYVSADTGSFHINSSPFVVVDSLDDYEQVYWGDLHGHHGHIYTDAQTLQRRDEYMEYARDVTDLDFACESHKTSSYYNVEEVHAELDASMIQYNKPGRFVPIRGYEWMGDTNSQGHHNAYFSGLTAGPLYDPDDPASDTLDEMWWLLETTSPPGADALFMPHALLPPDQGSGSNWHDFYNTSLNQRYRRAVEIYSHWGNSESGPGSAREALIYGNRIGFYGSSDTHFAYPGNPQTEDWGERGQDYVAGLAAVRATTLTRPALWQGLMQRRSYATEGERIFVDFTVDDHPMGSEISTTVAPRIAATVAGTAPLSEVIVFKGSYVTGDTHVGSVDNYFSILHSVAGSGEMWTAFVVTDSDFDASTFYYVRVLQTDGKRAWGSPVWVDYGEPVDLWEDCGNGVLDPGETLINCPVDARIAQRSWLADIDGTPTVVVSGTDIPMVGLHVYNVSNITGYVPYTSSLWVPYMQDMVDRVYSSGLSYLGFSGIGLGTYQGPAYPTTFTLTIESNWDLDKIDDLFDYAAQRGVYLLPTINASKMISWWVQAPSTHGDMVHLDSNGKLWQSTASFNNPEYWATADPLFVAIIRRYRDHPALLGWDVRIGEGENNYPPPYVMDPFNPPTTWCDYSTYAHERFQAWLRERYDNDVDLLRAAWVSPTVYFTSAMIPKPMDSITPATRTEVLPYINSSADARPEFRDWLKFRLDEKYAETEHFVNLFHTNDPNHIIVNAASVPHSDSSPRTGRQDGERAYRAPVPDVLIYHPRIAHEDDEPVFNTSRANIYHSDQYAVQSGKLTIWANEETSEVSEGYDVDNIWRLASFDIMHAALGQGDGWTTGDDDDPDNLMPTWSPAERAEMRRLAPIHSAPDLRVPQPKIAILSDDFNDGFNYPLSGSFASQYSRDTDRRNFAQSLFEHGLTYDLLTVRDVISYPERLRNYDAVLVMNLSRLTTTVAYELDQYRDDGGGLFIAGVTGRMNAFGRPNTEALEILLDVSITGWISQEMQIDSWEFDATDPLVGPLYTTIVTDNVYYIPVLPIGHFTEVAHLAGALKAPVVGYRGKTVFWFPRLTLGDDADLIQFQKNLWAFFGVQKDGIAAGSVEVTGGNYRSVFAPTAGTVDVALDDSISTTGALVWDWNGMRFIDNVPADPSPRLTFDIQPNTGHFMGLTPLTNEVQFVALSGGFLGPTWDDVAENKYSVGVYHARPGQSVKVVFYLGDWSVKGVSVSGGVLTEAGLDPSGEAYVATVSPLDERLTITLEYESGDKKIYLPLVLRDS